MTLNHQSLPTDLTDTVVNTLKSLHRQAKAQGHEISWFIDTRGNVRLLATVVTEWHTHVYRTDVGEQVVTVPIAYRSDDLSLTPDQVEQFGIDGLFRHVESELGLTPASAAAIAVNGQSARQRAA